MFGERLRELRKSKRMTLEDLAAEIGTSKQTIHRYENGIISNIPAEKIVLLAEALGTTPAALMGWSEDSSAYRDIKGVSPIEAKRLPVLGDIACGKPIYADESYESFIAADGSLDADFCLRAHGDSMVGARIYDGDIVFIRAQNSVDNGEIAAVIINDEATLKRVYFYPDEAKLVLSPENPRYAPLVYLDHELESIKIIGKAVAFQSAVI
jgi:repressor LexA